MFKLVGLHPNINFTFMTFASLVRVIFNFLFDSGMLAVIVKLKSKVMDTECCGNKGTERHLSKRTHNTQQVAYFINNQTTSSRHELLTSASTTLNMKVNSGF